MNENENGTNGLLQHHWMRCRPAKAYSPKSPILTESDWNWQGIDDQLLRVNNHSHLWKWKTNKKRYCAMSLASSATDKSPKLDSLEHNTTSPSPNNKQIESINIYRSRGSHNMNDSNYASKIIGNKKKHIALQYFDNMSSIVIKWCFAKRLNGRSLVCVRAHSLDRSLFVLIACLIVSVINWPDPSIRSIRFVNNAIHWLLIIGSLQEASLFFKHIVNRAQF